MNINEARKLKRGDEVKVTQEDVTFIATIVDKDDSALSFMENVLDNQGRTGIVLLK